MRGAGSLGLLALAVCGLAGGMAWAQAPAAAPAAAPAVATTTAPAGTPAALPLPACEARGPTQRPLDYPSVQRLADGRVRVRLCAPAAPSPRLVSADITGLPMGFDGRPAGLAMALDAQGYWSADTPAALPPGSYRYGFSIGGVTLPDPQASHHSELAQGLRSVLEVPGGNDGLEDWRADVPHGQVSVLEYAAPRLGGVRRAHVYTPPGYDRDAGARYPLLVLVHGYGDSDQSWTSIGQAHRILDNLIARGLARPMIVVMPFAHTPQRDPQPMMPNTDFGDDLHQVLLPLVESRWRTLATPAGRAMVGLSMGGFHTLNFGLPRPDVFGAVGVFSIGVGTTAEAAQAWRQRHAEGLKQRAASGGLVFYAYGRSDFIYGMAAPTRQLLDELGIHHTWHETEGGHSWDNWRRYLAAIAPLLFR